MQRRTFSIKCNVIFKNGLRELFLLKVTLKFIDKKDEIDKKDKIDKKDEKYFWEKNIGNYIWIKYI